MEIATKPNYTHVLKQLNGAIKTFETYPTGHPATNPALEKSFSALSETLNYVDQVTISLLENRIVVNGKNIEGSEFLRKMQDEFIAQNINSLTFTKDLTKEEFSAFLSFFIKPAIKDKQSPSLLEFLEKNKIHSIQVDQVRYELVSRDEVVVKTDLLEGADLKARISTIIKDNPDLLRDILLNQPVKKEAIAEKFGSEIDLHQLTAEIGKQLKELSDNEILVLVASSLEEKLKTSESRDQSTTLNETVDLVHKLLEDREKRRLLPEVKKILSERGIIEKDYLDFIFDEKWLKSQAVLDELDQMIEKLGNEDLDLKRFTFLWHRVIRSEDPDIKSYAIDRILSKLDSEASQTRSLAVSALKEMLSHSIKVESNFESAYIKDYLYKKIKDQLMAAHILKDYTELLKVIFFEMIKKLELQTAHQILLEYHARLSPEATYPDEVKEIALCFVHEVSDESTLAILISQMKEGVLMQNIRLVEEILESLDKDKVAEKLLDIFTVSDRTARMSALRVLSRLGKSSVSTLSVFLSNPGTFLREKETELLANESWYKVRNAIYVLGNIPSEESVQTLSKLIQDSDLRVRLETIKSLERIGGAESVNALLTFLSNPEDEARKSAITSLVRLGDRNCLPSLIEHFRANRKDKPMTLSAIGKIGGEQLSEDSEHSRTIEDGDSSTLPTVSEWFDFAHHPELVEGRIRRERSRTIKDGEQSRTIKFLLAILWEEELGIKNLSAKEKDELKIAALNILGKIGSLELTLQIEKFLSHKKKGLKGFLGNDRLIESAHRALKTLKSKYNNALPDTISRHNKT